MSKRVTSRDGELQKTQAAKVTVGGSPHSIVLSELGLCDMENADYSVLPDGETAARVTVDESTITAKGFDLLGGAATEVVHLVIVGDIDA